MVLMISIARALKSRSMLKLSVACIPTAVSALLVFWNLKSLGLSHWDEYNYVITAMWLLGRKGGVFTIYEPPGFSVFVAIFFKIFGVHDYVAISVSGVFAVMTVALVTAIGVKSFGLRVGITAPILLILPSLFLIYSRMALTDVAFTFFFTASVFSTYLALKSGKPKHVILAALLFAACNGIKYNGFMALVIPLLYVPIILKDTRKADRLKKALKCGWRLALISLPSVALGFMFVLFLGVGGSLRNILSLRLIKLISIGTLVKGLSKFQTAAIQAHAGQLSFLPLREALFYLKVLVYWVPLPVLTLAILGLGARRLKDSPKVFTSLWFLSAFIEITSIPAQYSRALLPVLPPLALLGGLGVVRLESLARSLALAGRLKFNLRLRSAIPILALLLVLLTALSPLVQTLALSHNAYREVGQILQGTAGNSTVLAETQPVIAFYYPVSFGSMTESNLAKASYLVVDFIGAEQGLQPKIQLLEQQGRLKLVASVHNDAPILVYLDSLSFEQLRTWNYTEIQIYKVENVTQVT